MTIRLHKLVVTGAKKEPAILDLHGETHLIFGPTDTGKSYIVECLRYCLGSNQHPKDIGYSEGYSQMVLQVSAENDTRFTFFRDLIEGNEVVYPGFHTNQPQSEEAQPISKEISQLLVTWGMGSGRKILVKSGKLGNLTAGDLRRACIFDEMETLNNVPLVGKDTNLMVRNRSATALILTGVDDSSLVLPPSTDKRNIAKGHVEALTEEVASLREEIPEKMLKSEAEEALGRISAKIEDINIYLRTNARELESLKNERARIDKKNQAFFLHLSALNEAENRFQLLNKKYENDLQRLRAIGVAASVVTNFESRPCPICLTDMQHQFRNDGKEEDTLALRQAAQAESNKILDLRIGLQHALSDISEELKDVQKQLNDGQEKIKKNIQQQEKLISPEVPNLQEGLPVLTERKSMLAIIVRDLERAERLDTKIQEMKKLFKRKKQEIKRDTSDSATLLCIRTKTLLNTWGVPGVDSVHYDESVSDIEINQRQRISYGKGKRGIFLTAYVIALMERAVSSGHPHLGIIIVDSPVVTYKDPKYGSEEGEELLPEIVKDKFYKWLSEYQNQGQIIVLENESPEELLKPKLRMTEFMGHNKLNARAGFYPT